MLIKVKVFPEVEKNRQGGGFLIRYRKSLLYVFKINFHLYRHLPYCYRSMVFYSAGT